MAASPTIRRRQLSAILRRLRKDAGLSLEEAAKRLEWSRAKLGHIETGERKRLSVVEVKALMQEYGVNPSDPRHDAVLSLVRQAQKRGWWTRYDDILTGSYVELEAEATHIANYEASGVPGLLQTPGYARLLQRARLWRNPEDIQRAVEARMKRQEILTGENPPELWVVIEEHALQRLAGAPDVMREQIEHLVDLADSSSHVTIQVLPTSAGVHAGVAGPFVIMEFLEPASPIVYLETFTDGLYLERPEEIALYRKLWDHIRSSALDEERTIPYLKQMIRR
ncbi:helix-turn-helix domain-containing protein [Thermobifida halotolerans]|uniref:Helix-turn-helix domain-containing protein n=1 Tax=Thermobifida halotolerans TaxID=483545 RepID=A0AA97LWC1_9ACTN|nr:helix-turn-helix transcriptional regulator [Thermobifida halotolerans]UOE19101.1 helix-turn-helix domain-containing protein [Thermobifida halotolerans]